MQSKPLSEITILADRLRVATGDGDFNPDVHKVLMPSILDKGLMHPVLLTADGKHLIAGWHRYHAIKLLHERGMPVYYSGEQVPVGHVPYTLFNSEDKLKVLEAEFEENDNRVEMSWKETAKAVDRLHSLRTAQRLAETGQDALSPKERSEVTTQVASELEMTYGPTSEHLLIAENLADPTVRKAKTKKEAIKIIKQKLAQEQRAALASEFDLKKANTEHTLLNMDLRDALPNEPAEKYSCVICDPPYGMGADNFKNQAAVKHTYDDSADYADELMKVIASECLRITTPQAHMYVFCDIKRFEVVAQIMREAGWDRVWTTPLIWSKGSNAGIAPVPDRGPRRTYEAIVFANKGDKKINRLYPDVLSVPWEKSIERGAHKPVGLYHELLSYSVLPGDCVIDPTAGSGPILTAATKAKCVATAIEISEEGFGLMTTRLDEEKTSAELSQATMDTLNDFLGTDS